jgi:hypothetical protein
VTPTSEYTFRISIDVPEGRAGMQPSLALAYASILSTVQVIDGLPTIGRRVDGNRLSFADLNGDGIRSTFVFACEPTGLRSSEALSEACVPLDPPAAGAGQRWDQYSFRVADIDGDGADDILAFLPGRVRAQRFHLNAQQKLAAAPFDLPPPDALGDFNGDGLLDLLRLNVDGLFVYRQQGPGATDRIRAVSDEGATYPRVLCAARTTTAGRRGARKAQPRR